MLWCELPEKTPKAVSHSENLVSVLLCGRSGSGKTTITKKIIDQVFKGQKKKKVYVINEKDAGTSYERIDWKALESLSNCGLIIEDLVRASEKHRTYLQQLLSFSCSHLGVNPIIVVVHSVTGNNIFGLLQHFRFIYIAATQSSHSSLIQTMRHFGYDKSEIKAVAGQLKLITKEFLHFVFKVETRELKLTSALEDQQLNIKKTGGEPDTHCLIEAAKQTSSFAPKENAREIAARFLALVPQKEIALAVFDIVYPALPQGRFNPDTMTVKLLRGENEYVVCLIDYIAAVVNPSPESASDDIKLLIKFHEYLMRKGVRLPRLFLANQHFKQ